MLNSLRNNWNALIPLQRAAIVAVLAAVFAGITLLTFTTVNPSYGVLFSNLSMEEAGKITAKLKDSKIDYKLSDNGQTIQVPSDKVYELRLSVANAGLLPQGGNVGFEIFDKPAFGASDFINRVNYQRALVGELTRTIKTYDGILDARINLAMPEKSVFTQNTDPVKASVYLKLRPNFRLDPKKIVGITNLISSGVERLTPENVSLVGDEGPLNVTQGSADFTNGQFEFQTRLERRLTDELQVLANKVLGPGKSAIRVNIEMNWDQSQKTKEVFTPSSPRGENLIVEESTDLTGFSKTGMGTTPGVITNVIPVLNNLKPGDFKDSKTRSTRVVNREYVQSTTAPGTIKRISVGGFIDAKIDAAEELRLRNALAASVGLDLTSGGRGDKIELMTKTFDTTVQDQEKKEELAASKQEAQTNLVRNGAALGTLLLVGILTLLMTKRSNRKPRRPRLNATIGDDAPPSIASSNPESDAIGRSLDPRTLIDETPEAVQAEPMETETSLSRLRSIAADQPEEVAMMLQDWLRGPSKPLR